MLVAFITAAMDTQFDYCAGRNMTSLTPDLYGSVEMGGQCLLIIIIKIIRNLYSAIMPLGGYRGCRTKRHWTKTTHNTNAYAYTTALDNTRHIVVTC